MRNIILLLFFSFLTLSVYSQVKVEYSLKTSLVYSNQLNSIVSLYQFTRPWGAEEIQNLKFGYGIGLDVVLNDSAKIKKVIQFNYLRTKIFDQNTTQPISMYLHAYNSSFGYGIDISDKISTTNAFVLGVFKVNKWISDQSSWQKNEFIRSFSSQLGLKSNWSYKISGNNFGISPYFSLTYFPYSNFTKAAQAILGTNFSSAKFRGSVYEFSLGARVNF